jgi:nitrite reductase/ring-hydroxylating ferredoxin subunit
MSDAEFVAVLEDLDETGARGFAIALADGSALDGFLVRRGSRVFAYADSCPHTGAPLAWMPDRYLDLEGAYVQCALHGALFIPESGLCVRGPCAGASLQALDVAIRDGRIYVTP